MFLKLLITRKLSSVFEMWSYQTVLIIFSLWPLLASAGTKGDEADLIIRTIFNEYKKEAHPNSKRADGAVVVQIGVNPLSLGIVSYGVL